MRCSRFGSQIAPPSFKGAGMSLDDFILRLLLHFISPGEIEERRSSLNRNQILELSERSKWEMKDELMEKRIVRRFGSKIHVKSKKHAVVEEIKVKNSTKRNRTAFVNN